MKWLFPYPLKSVLDLKGKSKIKVMEETAQLKVISVFSIKCLLSTLFLCFIVCVSSVHRHFWLQYEIYLGSWELFDFLADAKRPEAGNWNYFPTHNSGLKFSISSSIIKVSGLLTVRFILLVCRKSVYFTRRHILNPEIANNHLGPSLYY